MPFLGRDETKPPAAVKRREAFRGSELAGGTLGRCDSGSVINEGSVSEAFNLVVELVGRVESAGSKLQRGHGHRPGGAGTTGSQLA